MEWHREAAGLLTRATAILVRLSKDTGRPDPAPPRGHRECLQSPQRCRNPGRQRRQLPFIPVGPTHPPAAPHLPPRFRTSQRSSAPPPTPQGFLSPAHCTCAFPQTPATAPSHCCSRPRPPHLSPFPAATRHTGSSSLPWDLSPPKHGAPSPGPRTPAPSGRGPLLPHLRPFPVTTPTRYHSRPWDPSRPWSRPSSRGPAPAPQAWGPAPPHLQLPEPWAPPRPAPPRQSLLSPPLSPPQSRLVTLTRATVAAAASSWSCERPSSSGAFLQRPGPGQAGLRLGRAQA